jgi:hypothetical protein
MPLEYAQKFYVYVIINAIKNHRSFLKSNIVPIHTIKAHRGSTGTDPFINLGTSQFVGYKKLLP